MPVYSAGQAVSSARLVVLMLHGRGGSAHDILSMVPHIEMPGVAFIAPQAAGNAWYPSSFLAPDPVNAEGVASAHAVIEQLLDALEVNGITRDRCALLGFSQGACLAVDHAYRYPRRYAFVAGLTGGVIGPPNASFMPKGSLWQTPVFLGASDPDAHVPWARVEQSARVLEEMGASVDLVRYPGAPHAILPDQLDRASRLISHSLTEVE